MSEYIDKQHFIERMRKTNRFFDVIYDIEQEPPAKVVPQEKYEELLKAYEDLKSRMEDM